MVSIANTPWQVSGESRTQPLARFAWLTVIYNVSVILWGAYVRASGSGAGCGGHWPLCNGTVLPKSPQFQTIVEFSHRLMSAVALVMMSVLIVWCWRKTSKRDCARYSAIAAGLLLLNEAVLGALLVLLDHVGVDQSIGRAIFLCLHFSNTLLLLAALALTATWLSKGVRQLAVTSDVRKWLAVGVGLASVIAIGITGSLAALGDTLFPATSLRLSLAQDFSTTSHVLLRLRLLHPFAAIVGLFYILWLLHRLSEQGRPQNLIPLLTGTLLVQIFLGILNVILLAPVWLQLTHLLVADLLWVFLVLASAGLLLQRPIAAAR
jgi:heme a synthase